MSFIPKCVKARNEHHSVQLPSTAAVTFRRYAELEAENPQADMEKLSNTLQRAVYYAALYPDPVSLGKAELTEAKVYIEQSMTMNFGKANYLIEVGCHHLEQGIPWQTHPGRFRCYREKTLLCRGRAEGSRARRVPPLANSSATDR